MTIIPGLLTTLAAAALVVGGSAAPATASVADNPPRLVVVPEWPASFPQQVPPAADVDDVPQSVGVTVHATSPVNGVTVTASGAGLTFDRTSQTLGRVGTRLSFADFFPGATSPGFHTMTVTVTGDGVEPVTVTLPRIWTAGGPPLAGGDSLAGRAWGWQGAAEGYMESSVRASQTVVFADGRWAWLAMPGHGRPRCGTTPRPRACLPYAYDATSGLVQVGDDVIGKITGARGSRLATSGLLPSEVQYADNYYGSGVLTASLAFAKRGQRLAGHWRYRSQWYPVGLTQQDLRLRRDGRYSLTWKTDDSRQRHLTGRYRVQARGELVLRSTTGRKQKSYSLLLRTATDGTPRPGALGIWLVQNLGSRGHHYSDGNLMRPVR